MSAFKENRSLFREFPPVTNAEWEARILSDLKGADYEKKLIWKSSEGFRVKPYYRAENLRGLEYLENLANIIKPEAARNEWLICQDIIYSGDISDTKNIIDNALIRGADAVNIHFPDGAQPAREAVLAFADLFVNKGVEIRFSGIKDYTVFRNNFLEILKEKNYPTQNLNGSLGFDPVGILTRTGQMEDEGIPFRTLADILSDTQKYAPGLRVLEINGRLFQDAGSTLVQELGYAIAVGVEYLDQLTELGLEPLHIANSMQFNFATGPNYFMEIAKLRAARLLWKKVCDAYEIPGENQKMYIHSTSAAWNLTLYDPHVNMLRTTSETMSAILGGADSISVLPYDYPYRQTTKFSDRIARNTQIILKEEAHFDKVSDPAAGSYYMENLTDSLVKEAWELFISVEKTGGYLKTFQSGSITESVNNSVRDRSEKMASRRQALLGTSQFPNFSEFILDQVDQGLFEKEAGADHILALKPFRASAPFEQVRLETEKSRKRPKVLMLKYGNPAWMTARAMFSGNFFACAGYEIINPPGVETVEEGIAQAKKAKADVVVICSSDDLYPEIAPKIFAALSDRAEIVIAGYPTESIDILQNAGFKHFIHIRTNLLETLQIFNKILL